MGSTRAHREQSRTGKPTLNSDGSKMLPAQADYNPKRTLTIQERLQDCAMAHWRQPIDEALEVHLHQRLFFTEVEATNINTSTPLVQGSRKTLTPDSWTKWSQRYCKLMVHLIMLVSSAEANQRLSGKMAAVGCYHLYDHLDGLQPWMIKEIIEDVTGRKVQGPSKPIAGASGRGKTRTRFFPGRGQSTRGDGSGSRIGRGGHANTGERVRGGLYVAGNFGRRVSERRV